MKYGEVIFDMYKAEKVLTKEELAVLKDLMKKVEETNHLAIKR